MGAVGSLCQSHLPERKRNNSKSFDSSSSAEEFTIEQRGTDLQSIDAMITEEKIAEAQKVREVEISSDRKKHKMMVE